MAAGLQVEVWLSRQRRPWSSGAALQMIKEMQENKHADIQTVTNDRRKIKWLERWSSLYPGRMAMPSGLKLGESSLRKYVEV